MNKVELTIKGMTCNSCGNSIRRRIDRLDFVHDAIVDWKTGIAIIHVKDNNEQNLKKLKDTITKIGYQV